MFALIALSGCSGPSDRGDGSPRDTLVIAVASEPHDLLPVVYQTALDGNILANIDLPLLEPAFDCGLTFQPGLAREWSLSPDGRTVHVRLRDDARWADDTPVTAEDVRFTWELAADPRVQSPSADSIGRLSPKARPKVVSPTELEWTFLEPTDPTAMLAIVASIPPLPKHLLDGPSVDRASLRGHPLNVQSPVGDGPWKVEEWVRGQRLVLAPNDRFAGPEEMRPRLGRVVLQVIPDYDARIAALEAGEVDLVEGVQVADADRLAQGHPGISLRRRGWRSVEYVAWNELDPADAGPRSVLAEGASAKPRPHPLFADREVRRALAMAIDTDALIKDLLTSSTTGEVYGRPAVGTITPALCGVHDDAIQPLHTTADDARARLAELGWADTNNDGWLDRDGRPFRFTLLTNAAFPRRAQAAALVHDQLAKVGVDAQVESLEPAIFFERLRSHDFDAALSSWAASLYVDPTAIWGKDSEFNFTGFEDPKVSDLLARGVAEPDPKAAADIWRSLQEAIYAEQPYAFLYWTDEIVAVDGRFENATVDVLGPWRRLWEWSVAPEKVKRPVEAP